MLNLEKRADSPGPMISISQHWEEETSRPRYPKCGYMVFVEVEVGFLHWVGIAWRSNKAVREAETCTAYDGLNSTASLPIMYAL